MLFIIVISSLKIKKKKKKLLRQSLLTLMESNIFTTLSGRNMFKIISLSVGLHKCELKIRRLNTKQLPRSRSEETTPNLLDKEISFKS